jgi:hypothetical protein
MEATKKTCDVFISHGAVDRTWAAEVSQRFSEAGMTAFRIDVAEAPVKLEDTVWEALAESSAIVVLISSPTWQAQSSSIEVGAAMAWEKPAFALFKGRRPQGVPAYVEQFGVFPSDELDRLVGLVRKKMEVLSEKQQQVLFKAYNSLGVPAERLVAQPSKVDQLARRFNRATKSKVSPERLLREILRWRKQGKFRAVGHHE